MTRNRMRSGYGHGLRSFLRLAAVVGSVAAFASCASSTVDGDLCTPPSTECDGACVDAATDHDHCGACGHACAEGETCLSGECAAGGAGGAGGTEGEGGAGGVSGEGCVEGYTQCDALCVDIKTDVLHCGDCEIACAVGKPCIDGVCEERCSPGLTLCSGECADLETDVRHCGTCTRACSPGATCVSGACECDSTTAEVFGPTIPQIVTGSTATALDVHPLSCDRGGGPDATYLFTAPGAGTYFFETTGSAFDTVLGALNPDSCGELACNDQAVGVQSQIALDLSGGQTVLVVVSGAAGAKGDFTLTVSQPGLVPCAPVALSSTLPITVTGSTAARGDSVATACNFGVNGDVTYTFTAPTSDRYLIDASSSFSGVVVDVLDGGTCTGPSLSCYNSNQDRPRSVVDLVAGQTVLIAVEGDEGTTGDFALTIEQAPACPGVDLGSVPQTVTGSNAGLRDILTPSCDFFGGGGEATFSFTAPADDLYVFDTFGSDVNTVLEVRDGSCAGASLKCNDDARGTDSQVTMPLLAGQTVVVVVDAIDDGGSGGAVGNYVLTITEVPQPPCPMVDFGSSLPQTATGSNAGFVDVLAPSCGGGVSGGEATYGFTAPADGYYDFDSSGSTLPVVLSVLDGSCAGAELACDITDSDHSARRIVPLTAGQSVIVSVDSEGDVGDYVLNVSQFIGEGTCVSPTVLEPTVPQTVLGDTTGFVAMIDGSCSSDSGPDAAYSFTAPVDGTYGFDTLGTPFDTVLHLHDGTCAGAELDCNDDFSGSTSEVSATLTAGQTVVVVVDGYSGNSGPFTLNVH